MASFRQNSFAGGELAPVLWGRSDFAKYAVGLKTCRNFFVSRHGAAVSRPGTVHRGFTAGSGKVRLIPFVYSDELSFVLEFSNNLVRFWRNGSLVLNSGPVFSVATPYVTADLPRLKYVQQGAALTLTHPNYPPAELKLTSTAQPYINWTYAAIVFDRPQTSGPAFYLQEPLPGLNLSAWDGTVTYNLDAVASYGGYSYVSVAGGNTNHLPTDTNWWLPDTTRLPREWTWAISEIVQDSRGILYEKKPVTLTLQGIPYFALWNNGITYKGGAHNVGTQVSSDGVSDGGSAIHTYRCILANRGKLLSNATYWVIDDIASSPAHIQTDPLPGSVVVRPDTGGVVIVLNGSYANALTDPSFVGYRIYRGRGGILGWIGDAKANVSTFTDPGDEPDYTRQPPQGTNPFKFYDASGVLASTEYPACASFFEGRRYFANTSQRAGFYWGSKVDDYANFDSALIPTEESSIQFELASHKLEEIRFMVGWQRMLMGTQSSIWSVGGDGGPMAFNNVDAKVQTSVGTSWVDPLLIQGTVLFVRSKGTGVHSLDQDVVRQSWSDKDLSILSEHLFINHQVTDWAYAQDPWQLIWAVRDDGVLLSLTYIRDQEVWAWAQHSTSGGAFESVCVVPEGQEDAVYFVVNRTGVRHMERMASRVITDMTQAVCLDCSSVQDIGGSTTVNGLSYLPDGTSVWALVDGAAEGNFLIFHGAITLPGPGNHVIVGLPYSCQLQTLDLVVPGNEMKARPKNVWRVGIEVDNSRGLAAGPDFDHMADIEDRDVADSFASPSPTTALVVAPIAGGWTKTGGVCLQQNYPLPVTVLSILREVDFGDF